MSAGDDEFKVAAPSFFIVGTKGGSAQTVGIETAKLFEYDPDEPLHLPPDIDRRESGN